MSTSDIAFHWAAGLLCALVASVLWQFAKERDNSPLSTIAFASSAAIFAAVAIWATFQ